MTENTAAAKATATAAIRRCRCGCEAPLGGKAAYRPGHDARHVSNLKKRLEEIVYSDDRQGATGQFNVIQTGVYAIFAELKTEALRQKLGRAVDNDKEGLYNSFGDAGIYVPHSENPSLGRRHEQTDLQAKFEAAYPIEEGRTRKVKDSAPAVADEPWITHEPTEEEVTVPEPMWTETTQDETPLEVKIGRWVYPARRTEAGLERNTKRDGSGEWVEADVMDLFRS